MGLIIVDNKVLYVSPPKKLTSKEKEFFENSPVNKKLIKKATSRKYKII